MSDDIPPASLTAIACQLVRKPRVKAILDIGNTMLHERLNPNSPYFDEAMPQPIYFKGGRTPYWRLKDIEEYVASLFSPATPKIEGSPEVKKSRRNERSWSLAARTESPPKADLSSASVDAPDGEKPCLTLTPAPSEQAQRHRVIAVEVRKKKTFVLPAGKAVEAAVSDRAPPADTA